MAAPHSVDPAEMLEQDLASASPDMLREMIASFANAMMSAQADQVCGAGYGERSVERVNRRNGYQMREWDTRAGTVELAVPKLREGSFYPDWLLTHRPLGQQLLDIPVRQPVPEYQCTATMIASGGNRNPAKPDRGGRTRQGDDASSHLARARHLSTQQTPANATVPAHSPIDFQSEQSAARVRVKLWPSHRATLHWMVGLSARQLPGGLIVTARCVG